MLKINLAELKSISKPNTKESTSNESSSDVKSILAAFFQTYKDALLALDFIAVTNGPHNAYFISILEEESSEKFVCDYMTIPDLTLTANFNVDTNIYPIGAGDAVAAGTIAAWEFYFSSKLIKTSLNYQVQNALSRQIQNMPEIDKHYMASQAFAFGIACGSASCLVRENSFLT